MTSVEVSYPAGVVKAAGVCKTDGCAGNTLVYFNGEGQDPVPKRCPVCGRVWKPEPVDASVGFKVGWRA